MARKITRRLKIVHPECAGIDIGGSRHYVLVDPQRSGEPVRSFGSFTDELTSVGKGLLGSMLGKR